MSSIFRKRLSLLGLTRASTASEIQQKTSKLLQKYGRGSKFREVFYDYLDKELHIEKRTVDLFRARQSTLRHRRSNFRVRHGLTIAKPVKDDTIMSETLKANIERKVAKRRQQRQIEKQVQYEEFKKKIQDANLSFDMDPREYAEGEEEIRKEYGTWSYGYYGGLLRDEMGVSPEWRHKHELALKSMARQRSRTQKLKRKAKVKTHNKDEDAASSEGSKNDGEAKSSKKARRRKSSTLEASSPKRPAAGRNRASRRLDQLKVGMQDEQLTQDKERSLVDALSPAWPIKRRRTTSQRQDLMTYDDSSGGSQDNKFSGESPKWSLASSQETPPLPPERIAAKRPRIEVPTQEERRPTHAAKTYRGSSRQQVATIKPLDPNSSMPRIG